MVKCGNCRFYECDFPFFRHDSELENPVEGASGRCNWMQGQLPHSFRYATREVMSVYSLEEITCPQFESVTPIYEELKNFANEHRFTVSINGKRY